MTGTLLPLAFLGPVLNVGVDVVLITLVLALAAYGLAIIFGLIGVINLGHGAMLTMGAYFTWYAVQWNLPFIPALIVATIASGIVGLVLEHLVIRFFYDSPFETLLVTWAFFLIASEAIKLVFGTEFKSIYSPIPGAWELGPVSLPAYRSVVGLFALLVIAATAYIFYRTSMGIKVRALMQNEEKASLLGLNISLTYKLVFCVGTMMAGLAGGLIAPMLSINPYMGNIYLIRSFFVIIVGGIGQLLGGTLVGSFVIGGSETLFALVSGQVVAQTIVFVLAIVILRFRPSGILGEK